MVKIVKGKIVLKVSKGAFDSLYKNNGWELASVKEAKEKKDVKPVKEKVKEKKETVKKEVVEEIEPTVEEEEIQEDLEAVTPLSEMTVKELKAYAKEHNIDISGVSKATDIRGIIEAETEE